MRKVAAPTLAPRRCVLCPTGYKGGPVIDTLQDDPFGRVYVCLEHAKRLAVAAGFAAGDEMDKLKQAAERVAQAEKGEARGREQAEDYLAQLKELDMVLQQTCDERDEALGRAGQAEAKLAELGQLATATVAAVHRSDDDDPDPTPV